MSRGAIWGIAAAVVLVGLLVVHLRGSRGSGPARTSIAFLWTPVLIALSIVGLGLILSLFAPPPVNAVSTAFGAWMVRSLTVRLATVVLLAAAILWLGRSQMSLLEDSTPERRPSGAASFLCLTDFGMVMCIALGILPALVVLSAGDEDVPAQFHALGTMILAALRDDLLRPTAVLAAQRPVYAGALALLLTGLVAVHEQARRGSVAAMPFVAGVWTLLIAMCTMAAWRAWEHQPHPRPEGSVWVAVLVSGLLCLSALAVLALWAHWIRSLRRQTAVVDPGPAGGFGRLGMFAGVVFAGLLATEWIRPKLSGSTFPSVGAEFDRLVMALALALHRASAATASAPALRAILAVLPAVSVVGIALHYAAQRGLAPLRRALVVLWFVAALCCLFVAGMALGVGEAGDWSLTRSLVATLLILLVVNVLNATINSWLWLVRDGGRGMKDTITI